MNWGSLFLLKSYFSSPSFFKQTEQLYKLVAFMLSVPFPPYFSLFYFNAITLASFGESQDHPLPNLGFCPNRLDPHLYQPLLAFLYTFPANSSSPSSSSNPSSLLKLRIRIMAFSPCWQVSARNLTPLVIQERKHFILIYIYLQL